jgi:hypothetical protein
MAITFLPALRAPLTGYTRGFSTHALPPTDLPLM